MTKPLTKYHGCAGGPPGQIQKSAYGQINNLHFLFSLYRRTPIYTRNRAWPWLVVVSLQFMWISWSAECGKTWWPGSNNLADCTRSTRLPLGTLLTLFASKGTNAPSPEELPSKFLAHRLISSIYHHISILKQATCCYDPQTPMECTSAWWVAEMWPCAQHFWRRGFGETR